MKQFFMSSLYLSILTFCSTSVGYIYQIRVLARVDKQTQHIKQYIIGCSDYHEKKHPANVDHRNYLEFLLKKRKVPKTKFIVEDLSSRNAQGRGMCCGYSINSRGGVLGGFAHMAQQVHADVENIEFRYCRVAALGPLLNNPKRFPDDFKSCRVLTVGSLQSEVLNEIETIKKYDDGALLNNAYETAINKVRAGLKKSRLDHYPSVNIAHFCKKINKDKYIDILQEMCIFDSELIDVKLIHAIVSEKNKPLVIAIAGGTHIDNAFIELVKDGYELIFSTKMHLSKQQIYKNKLVNVNADQEIIFPQPVDMQLIEKFIN